MRSSVVIVAAGKGRRMGADINKQYLKLEGKEILAHTIEKFQNCDKISDIIIVTGREEIYFCQEHICNKYKFSKVKAVVAGGKERQDSVYNGLLEVESNTDIVLIHDGARPLIREKQIIDGIKEAAKSGACIIGVPSKDTIKICNHNKQVLDTPPRENLWLVQTPQVFKYNIIMEAYRKGIEKGLVVTDDSMMVEALGYPVKLVCGRYDNIKVTTPDDLIVAQNMI